MDERFNLKLADFGFSKSTEEVLTTFCGTYAYMAPEVLKNRRKNYEYDGNKIDIFSVGAILFILK